MWLPAVRSMNFDRGRRHLKASSETPITDVSDQVALTPSMPTTRSTPVSTIRILDASTYNAYQNDLLFGVAVALVSDRQVEGTPLERAMIDAASADGSSASYYISIIPALANPYQQIALPYVAITRRGVVLFVSGDAKLTGDGITTVTSKATTLSDAEFHEWDLQSILRDPGQTN